MPPTVVYHGAASGWVSSDALFSLNLTHEGGAMYNAHTQRGMSGIGLIFVFALIGFFVLATLYLSGLYTGLLVLKFLSFMPLIYLLLFYYLDRKGFIRLMPVVN